MKKLIAKDKKIRQRVQKLEKSKFLLKYISKNSNFLKLIRWNAFLKLKNFLPTLSESKLSSRCIDTVNKKRLNRATLYSRHVYLKLIRSGKISGMQKSSW